MKSRLVGAGGVVGAGAVRTPSPYAEGDSLDGGFDPVSAEVVQGLDMELESAAAGGMYARLVVLDDVDAKAAGLLRVVSAQRERHGEA